MINVNFSDGGLLKALKGTTDAMKYKIQAASLNEIATRARKDLIAAERSHLHLSREFLPRSTVYTPARSAQGNSMKVEIGLLDRVFFGKLLEKGGERKPLKKTYIAVHVTTGEKVKPKKLMKQTRLYFIKEINGTLGIWKNTGRGIKLEYVLKEVTEYEEAPYLDIDAIIERSVRTHRFDDIIMKNIMKHLNKR